MKNKRAYLVKSQEAYDELMKELEEKGYLWWNRDKPTELEYNAFVHRSDGICIYLDDKGIFYSDVNYFIGNCPKDYKLVEYPEKVQEVEDDE